MRRLQDEEDTAIGESDSRSVIRHRFRPTERKPASRLWLVVIVGTLAFAVSMYYLVHLINSAPGAKEIAALTADLERVKLNDRKANDKIADLQQQLTTLSVETAVLKAQRQAELPKPAPAAAPLPEPPKKDWMTPELLAISEKRKQLSGMGTPAKGTACELKLLMKNPSGQTYRVIYKDEETRKRRIDFQKQRVDFLKKHADKESLGLVRWNIRLEEGEAEEERRAGEAEYERIRGLHHLEEVGEEMPMCVVVPGYNNNAKFRLEYNLNSIFLQNYTNYFVVIINDASTDGSDELFRRYLHFYRIDPARYAYVENAARLTALENIYIASHHYCSQDSVVLNLDGDDEFIGRNVLKIFNAAYQRNRAGVVYSNFYWYEQGGNLMYGFTSDYTEPEKQNNLYRQSPQRFSHLRSYRTELFRKIAAKDFQDEAGKFFTSAYDMAMYFPLMELACKRISKISGFHYLYNINTGLNDYQVDRNKQASIDGKVRNAKKYSCDQEFDDRMRK